MNIGNLTGKGRGAAIDGEYAFHAPGLTGPLAPDLQADRTPGHGPVRFAAGSLTDGDTATGVGWRGATVGETGVDIVIRLGTRCFVDQVVLRQPPARPGAAPVASPGVDGIEAVGHVEPEGLSRVEVYALLGNDGVALVGCAGQRGPEVFPAGPIWVSVGVEAEELTIRLISYQRDIRVTELEIWGAGAGEPAIFPVPAAIKPLPGPAFVLADDAVVLIGGQAADDTVFAATLLAEKLQERFGRTVSVRREEGAPSAGAMLVGKPGESQWLEAVGVPSPVEAEGYTLQVETERALVLAADRRGLVYGVEAFLQLLTTGDSGPAAAPCLVEDAPRLPFRGAHLFLPARDQLDYTKRLIRYLLAPMRLNTIFLELAGGMRFDRRPEIAEAWERNNRLAAEGKAPAVPHGEVAGGGWLTKAEVGELVDCARQYGIEVIPEIQSLSHVQYLTMTYPEIAEQPVEDGYPDAYCPLHPKSREIVFDMIDEVVELLGPLRYLHLGHDEVYTMAQCPRCKGKSRGELYAHDVNALYVYLQQKGIGMMVWADMLQPWQRYAGPEAAALIPKDIVMLDFVWYFRPWSDTEDLLLKHGFEVIFGNCYSSHFTRYASRTAKPGVIGTQVSVWSGTSEEDMGRLGKLYDLIYSANTAWSIHCQEELRWTFDRRIADLMPGIRAGLRGLPAPACYPDEAFAPLDLQVQATAPRRDQTGALGGYELSGLPFGETRLRDRPFRFADGVILVEGRQVRNRRCPEEVAVPLGARVAALIFAHTCTSRGPIPQPFGPRQPVGWYEVRYTDGQVETIEIAFGYHLTEWNRRHGQPLGPTFHRHAGYVATYPVDPLWQGKTAAGEDVTLYGMEWINPHPEREVQSVRIRAARNSPAALIVTGITMIKADL